MNGQTTLTRHQAAALAEIAERGMFADMDLHHPRAVKALADRGFIDEAASRFGGWYATPEGRAALARAEGDGMSDMVQHTITHKVQARDDHPTGNGEVRWFASLDGGESYIGPTMGEPEPGDYVERKPNTLPVSLAYPRGFTMCGLTIVGEPVALGDA